MWKVNFALVLTLAAAPAADRRHGVGAPPTADQVRAWDITIAPDGTGLPEGSGSAKLGKAIYASKCAKCHGAQGQGADDAALVGGQGSLNTPKPLKTVGSFWPHATTLFDYVRRAMPFRDPGSLDANQVYALTAFVLHLNGIVREDDVLDARALPKVRMPNRDGFIPDSRPDTGPKAKRRR